MIQEKLTILKENGVIDEEIYTFSQTVIDYLKKESIIKEDSEADVFITHLAMAMARGKDKPIAAVDEAIMAEITSDEQFPKAKTTWEEIKEMSPIAFHENETGYFYLHLVNLLH
ncbi:PRD domain-containing protein [Atopococcus tabaci]|uniref:PRD domain-containing protein n=1 Tax=Atopococcus tabaci TaxID=269774 RepID=UPI002409BD8D|nr:PRD domain-containing protein [Atopococcus tabaci]